MVVTLEAVDDAQPSAHGRKWSADEYATRDTVLAALGIRPFPRRRALGER